MPPATAQVDLVDLEGHLIRFPITDANASGLRSRAAVANGPDMATGWTARMASGVRGRRPSSLQRLGGRR
jgi:hypothetical protein